MSTLAPIRHTPRLRLTPPAVRWLAISVSLLLHATLFLQFGGDLGQQAPATQVVSVSMVTLQASVERPRTETKPMERHSDKGEQAVPKEEEVEPPSEAQAEAQAQSSEQAPALDEGLLANARQEYFARVLAHIERHKFYPTTARRRGQEGVVTVRFVLLASDRISALHVDGASTLLQEAAREAVYRAIPFPAPPEGMTFPLELEVKIRYSLKDK